MNDSTHLRVTHTCLVVLCFALMGAAVHMYHTKFPAQATELPVPSKKTKADFIRLPSATEVFVSPTKEIVYGPYYAPIEVCAFIISSCLDWFPAKPIDKKWLVPSEETKVEPAPAPRKSRRGRRR